PINTDAPVPLTVLTRSCRRRAYWSEKGKNWVSFASLGKGQMTSLSGDDRSQPFWITGCNSNQLAARPNADKTTRVQDQRKGTVTLDENAMRGQRRLGPRQERLEFLSDQCGLFILHFSVRTLPSRSYYLAELSQHCNHQTRPY